MIVNCLVLLSFLAAAFSADIPAEWQVKIDAYNAFFGNDDTGKLDLTGYPVGLYLPTIGNGYLSHSKGVRSDTIFISGVFNGETTSPSHRARIPADLAVTIADTTTTGVLFDIESGMYSRRGIVNGTPVTYELRWYAHRTLRGIYVMELEVHLNGQSSGITLTLKNNRGSESEDITFEAPVTSAGSYSTCGSTKIPETPEGQATTVCLVSDVVPSTLQITKETCGKTFTFLSAYRTSLDSADARAEVRSDYENARALAASGSLLTAHIDGWSQLWQSGIEVSGRPDVAVAVNASLYAILSSVRDDWPYGLAPGGLTNYYNGHSFWDTETWMYPPLLFLHPQISQQLLRYRFDRIDGAKKKAASYSPPWSGTMFPWESAFSGVETCPTFAATGLREDHINGDIAFAVWQEWSMRQDKDWLRSIGYPMLTGIADFWVSRSTYQADGKAHILDIIPPDEYVDHVDDSVYSNFVAVKALNYAVQASIALNETCDQCAKYSQLAQDLVILFDQQLGIHPEYSGYPGNTVKQADVVLLHYPLGMEMDEAVQRADLEYYSPRTDKHGPAMTWGMHAIGFLDLGDFDSAAQFFNMSFQDNMHAPFQVWTETPDGNAVNFITGAGGFLQTMIAGYPGLRINDDGSLSLYPLCPEGADSVKIRSFQFHSALLDFEYHCPAQAQAGGKGRKASSLRLKVVEVAEGFVPLRFSPVKRGHGEHDRAFHPKPLEKGAEVELDLRHLPGDFAFLLW